MGLALAALCAGLVLLGGCGGDTEPESTNAAVETPSTVEATDPIEGPDGPTGEPDAAGRVIERGEIKFDPGLIKGTVLGSVSGFDGEVWTFEAEGGQTAELDIFTQRIFLEARVSAPDGSVVLTRTPGEPAKVVTLPESGLYEISLFLMRDEAQTGRIADYEATLTLYPRSPG